MNKFEKTLSFIKNAIREDSPFYQHIYLVGGCVRDELLGERYSDLDLLIDLPSGQRAFVEYMCQAYADVCKGPFYYQRYGTTAMDVIIDNSLTLVECVEPHVEEYAEDGVTLLQTRFCTLEEDSSRRDYTCNALYKNLHTGRVLDPTGRGVHDLREGILDTPSEPGMIYRQDPVRMLRGIRFKHQKNFRLTPHCWNAIVENAESMSIAAPKRMRDELNKMLKARSFGEGINDLLQSRLLSYVMPGLSEHLMDTKQMEGCIEGTTLWEHTRQALATQGREHPHTDSVYKLSCLVMDIALRQNREVVAELLLNAGIGKEKVASIIHITELYKRFSTFYRNGAYVARPSALPRFINGLAKNRDDFRRLVRALNVGKTDEKQLPWRIFYNDGQGPDTKINRSRQRRMRKKAAAAESETTPNVTEVAPSTPQLSENERRHRRNVKRREQRKRARTMKKLEAKSAQQNLTTNESQTVNDTQITNN